MPAHSSSSASGAQGETSLDNLWFLQLNKKICNSGKDSNISKLECWWHTCMKYLGGFHQNMIAQKLISSDNISSGSSQHRKSDIHSDQFLAKFLISPGLLQHNQALPYILLKRDKKTVLPKVGHQRRVGISGGWTLFSFRYAFLYRPLWFLALSDSSSWR